MRNHQLALRSSLPVALAALSSLAAGTLATAQEAQPEAPSLDELVGRIEELEARLALSPRTGSSELPMKIFGRLHLDGWSFADSDQGIADIESGADPGDGDDPMDTIEWRRARLGVSGGVGSRMSYKVELDFGKPDGLVYKDMYFSIDDIEGVGSLAIGNQKRPYGLDHLNSSKYNVFIERPFVIEAFNQDARRIGMMVYGESDDQAWNWRYGLFEMTDLAGTGELDTDVFQYELAGRVANTAMWADDGREYAHWALSGTVAFPESGSTNQARFRTRPEARSESRWIDTGPISGAETYELAGLEGVYNRGPLQVVGELQQAWVQRDGANEDVAFNGGYVYLAWFLTGEYMPWSRKRGILGRPTPNAELGQGGANGAWQVALRWSFADFSDRDVLGGEAQSLTLGLNWYWNRFSSLQFNLIQGSLEDRESLEDRDSVGDVFEGDYTIAGVRLRMEF